MFRFDSAHADRCRERRRRLLEECGEGTIVVRGGAPGPVNRNFAYLAGVPEPRGALVLSREGVRIGLGRANPGRDYQRGQVVHAVLFLPSSDPVLRKWGEDGVATLGSMTAEQAGVDRVLDVASFPGVVEAALAASRVLWVVRGSDPSLAGEPTGDERWVETVRRRWFHADVRDATPAVHGMRRVKDGLEVDLVRRAVEVTHEALTAGWATLAPGRSEREVEAEITRRYRAAGGVHAFDPIVGSGPNACLLHYTDNARTVENGELVLVDTGVSLDGYAADVTRTVPVSGRFGERQRELYERVLEAQEAAIAVCRPGALLADVHEAAWSVLDAAGLGDAFPHGTSHHLGADVHDVGDRFAPLEPGCVLTVEPGVYLADEGIGIRIEDDVRITEDGHEILTAAIPKRVDEVEAWLAGARDGRGDR